MNVVINLKDTLNPKKGDILVYNEKSGSWEIISKSTYLNDIHLEVNNTKEEIESLKQEILNLNEALNKTKEDIGTIAKIVKETII